VPSRGDEGSDEIALVAILDGVDLESRAPAFRGGSMLGGIAVDLRSATLAPEAHLTLHAILGGIAVRVPAEWRVESDVVALSGGVSIDVPKRSDGQSPLLVIHGFTLLGGIDIRAGVPLPARD
jgi:hypothetical protein